MLDSDHCEKVKHGVPLPQGFTAERLARAIACAGGLTKANRSDARRPSTGNVAGLQAWSLLELCIRFDARR